METTMETVKIKLDPERFDLYESDITSAIINRTNKLPLSYNEKVHTYYQQLAKYFNNKAHLEIFTNTLDCIQKTRRL